ncbi:MAG TPA: DUF3307 domain-containing protein [Flavobacterium sp.]|jgi:hypothetical protein
MIIFIKLLLAHLLGDFVLQPNSWVAHKEIHKYKSAYLYVHTLLHGILAWAVAGEWDFWPYAVILAFSHGLIDAMKLQFQRDTTRRSWFITDQVLHLFVLAVITMVYNNHDLQLSPPDNRFWILLTGVLFLTKPTSIVIKNIISVWTPENKAEITAGSLQNAGNYIGILERLFVIAFMLSGHFEAIGFLLGAKSIFRFGDLMEAKERKLTEYVLIGTLLSFGIAMLTGFLVQYALASLSVVYFY